MKGKATLNRKVLFLSLIGFFFLPPLILAQTDIRVQGFDGTAADNWTYASTTNTGSITADASRYTTALNSLRLGGSAANGSNDPFILFNNQSLTGYTDVKLSIAFSSDGSPDDNDDLWLDVSYDNGTSYTSTKLIDGKNSTTTDNLGFSHAVSTSNTAGSPFVFSIPNGTANVRVRIRFDEMDNQNNTTDYYYIDDIRLTGTATVRSIQLLGFNTPIDHNAAALLANGTDFGSTQIISDPRTNTFTIKNNGTPLITLSGTPKVVLTGSSDFSVITLPTSPIASLNTTPFQIKFNPITVGLKTATVSIANDDSSKNPFIFHLKGTGTQTFFDSDGDGVYDNVDIDDDNDGIRDAIEEGNCEATNGTKVNYKFLNETFGSGDRTTISTTYNASTTYCYENGTVGVNTAECPKQSGTDLDDGKYTVGKTAQIASWASAFWHMGGDHTGNVNGRMAIFNASNAPGIFYTAAITGALPNIPITYSFWVLNLDRTDADGIATRLRPNVKVEFRDFDGNLLAFINTGAIAPTPAGNLAGNWQQFTANLNLNVSAFKVIFINNETGGLGNDLALDDIQISQQLCDRDNDGVADVFDLDSDNDGIPDIIEAGLGNLSNGTARINVAWVDANNNGMHDAAEGTTTLLDSDGDGIPNYLDLDSDNDSIFDIDESGAGNSNAALGFVNGDGDINGDGVGNGIDSETFRSKDTNGDGIVEGFGDGILDVFDYHFNSYGNSNQGQATTPYLNYVLDTDGDGIPDYMDVKSNGTDFDISTTLYASLDTNNDGKIDGTADIDKDGILDAFDTNTSYFGSPRNLERKLFLELDGRNDYGQDTTIINQWPNATLMAWINLNSLYASDGIVVGQNKLHLKVDASKKLQAVGNTTTVTAPTALNTAQWIHVALVYDSGNSLLKLYINGTLKNSSAISGNLTADTSLFTIGKNPLTNDQFFKGCVDEIRLFNSALTEAQVQKMVHQEIQDNNGQIRGAIIPKDIPGLPWANLKRYYRMDHFKNDIIDDHTTTAIDELSGARIYNVKNIKVQQAPMPFVTQQTGIVATAVHSIGNQIRGQDAVDNGCSIVIVNHDITAANNWTNLGMIVNTSKKVTLNNDSKLQNDWYLKLDGKIDLEGRSQLVQTTDSDLDPSSTGSIERDQQGTKNIFNYNYWSSPVGPINATTNNTNYKVGTVFKDGTDAANPTNINWIGGYNGAAGTPISLARYWIYKFQNVSNAYANWVQIQENGFLAPSQGFTLKGSGSATTNQNYTFIGKPFNGTITNPIAANNLNLSGNPYASALDATEFINDNASSTTGILYFWEHSATNNTHNLGGYQGGYSARNATGGTPPIAPAGINGLGTISRIPGRFIPVGQGFFVSGNATGGNVLFKNSQRLFVKEDEVSSNILFRNANENITTAENNNNDAYEADLFLKIRLGYTTQNNYHRQVLLGFMNENATSGLDYGYDALLFDEQTNDLAFLHGTTKLMIQGDGFFNANTIYPLFVKSNLAGTVKFILDGLENCDPQQTIYIYDNDTNTYHDIRNGIFEVALPAGSNSTRFSLRFTQGTLNSSNTIRNSTQITHTQNENLLTINNESSDLIIKKVTLYNTIGQLIVNWDVKNEEQQNIRIPIQNLSSGTYIVKIETSNGTLSKKIIIQ